LRIVCQQNFDYYILFIMPFPYHLDFKTVNFRQNLELYRVGVGEQGVLLVQPYKGEILPFWKFKNVEIAIIASQKIYSLFEQYLINKDFVGADMARKYLQMGFTRARRYANHSGGKKYAEGNQDQSKGLDYPYSSGSKNKGNQVLPQNQDWATNEKAQVAKIYKQALDKANANEMYIKMKAEFVERYGR
jgi:uncharacterized protein YktA (UPF0223 family)